MFFTFLVSVGFSQNSEISLERGAFVKNFLDLYDAGSILPLELRRTFDSTSKHVGFFGKGSCSFWEDRVVFVHKELIKFFPCGFGDAVVFNLRNNFFRSKMGFLKKKEDGFLLIEPQGLKREFDSRGRLSRWCYQGNACGEFEWKNDQLAQIKSGSVSWKIKQNSKGRITEVTGPNGKASYFYNQDLLVRAVNQWGTDQKFSYDKKQQLIEISYSDRSKEKISYNSVGQVSQFSRRDGCTEKYDRQSNLRGSEMIVKARLDCPGRPFKEDRWVLSKQREKLNSLTAQQGILKQKDALGRVSSINLRDNKINLVYEGKRILPQKIQRLGKDGLKLSEYNIKYSKNGSILSIERLEPVKEKFTYSPEGKSLFKEKRQPAQSHNGVSDGDLAWIDVAQILEMAGF